MHSTIGADTITTVLVAAQSYNLVDLATVRDEMSVTDSKDDGFLARAISQASKAVANYCNRTFPVEVVQDAIYLRMDALPWRRGDQPLQLSRWPLVTTPNFTGNVAAAGATTITGLSSTAGLSAGLPISDANPGVTPPATAIVPVLAPGTRITAVNSGSGQITIAPATVGSGAGLSFVAGVNVSVSDPDATALVVGQDYVIDGAHGQLFRIRPGDGYPRLWRAAPTTVIYQAGYSTIPDDVIDATLRLVTLRYKARGRDPMLKSIEQPNLGVETYWVGGPPKSGSLPEEIAGLLDSYRVPVIA